MKAADYVNNGVFTVQIYGMDFSFAKVSGIGASVEFDTYTEGGGRMHLFTKPKTSASTIKFEKGMSVADKDFALLLMKGAEVTDIVINLIKNGAIVESYYIERGLVSAWELGELTGMTSGVAVKSFTISHTGLRVMS